MTFYRRPRVFISYRHRDRRGTPDADEYNDWHRSWVARFARDLAAWNVDVIYDGRLRDLLRPHMAKDPNTVAFVAEITTMCLHVAHVFIAIATPGYLESIGHLPDETGSRSGRGTVHQEWTQGLALVDGGQCEFISIFRSPVPVGFELTHRIYGRDVRWDFSQRVSYSDQIELLGERLHMGFTVERPTIDLPFDEWISLYIDWCHKHHATCATTPLDSWGCDFERAKRFLAQMTEQAQKGELPGAEEGSGRHDLDRHWKPEVDTLNLQSTGWQRFRDRLRRLLGS